MIILATVIGIVGYLFLKMWILRRKLPPGPFPLPLIGNSIQLAYGLLIRKLSLIEQLREWAEEFGPLYTFWLGPLPMVNICDYATAVDAMVKKGSNFTNRSTPFLLRMIKNERGVTITNGLPWLEQRRFTLHTLRNFGFGRNLIEERIMFEFNIFCETLDKRLSAGEKSIEPHSSLDLLIGNIINRMLFTERFEKKDEETFFALKRKMDEMAENFTVFDMLIDETLVKLPLIKQRANHLVKPMVDILAFIRNQVEQRKREISDGSHVLLEEGDDYVDAFFIQMAKEQKSGQPTSFDEEMLVMTLLDLWLAGQGTTVTTLYWAFAYLLLNPEVVSRVEHELFSVTEGKRQLSLSDRSSTQYFNATINEIHRCASLFPSNLWRAANEDTIVGSYVIPKGTAVAAQLSVIMNDKKFFKNSHQFNPDRYLNEDKLDQMIVPFGLGKRSCLGESLARAELYLIIANVLLRYKISADPDHMPSMKAAHEIAVRPFPLPLVGNFHQLAYGLFVRWLPVTEIFQEWVKKYGPVHTFWFGPMPTVNICSYDMAVDAMVKNGPNFVDRTIPYLFRAIRNGRGIVVANGPAWLDQRRFALHTFRRFGMGRNLMEERIMNEFNITCESIDRRLVTGKKMSIEAGATFDLLVGNIINGLLFTDRCERKDEETFFKLKNRMDEMMENFTFFNMLIVESSVGMPLIKQRTDRLMEPVKAILEFIRNKVEQRKREIWSGTHVVLGEGEDFVDAFLMEMERQQECDVPSSFDDEMLVMSVLDLWIAAQATTSTTLSWAFTFLLLHPEVRSRVEQELFSVTKGQRPLSYSDKPSTPYFNATITEIHRCASLTPLNLWRDTAEDTAVGSYVIPKGTAITAQLSLFNPDRYLKNSKLEHMVIPFGLGKRSCLGESLARAELYLTVANLLLRFKISLDPDNMPSMRATSDTVIMRRPRSYNIRFERK
ncbi:hypothetical protein Q1695_009824 [Nippostrongylus brasiliensis]|nr:hypothetical protein Q1695_009824 [Nippostrongylus brasiliensis]